MKMHDKNSIVSQEMVSRSRDFIFVIYEDLNFKTISASSKGILKYEPQELEGRSFLDIIAQKDKSTTKKIIDEIKGGSDISNCESCFVQKDGSELLLDWSVLWDKEHRLMYGKATVIPEIPAADLFVKDAEESYHYLFMDNPSPMLIWDFETLKFIECNNETLKKYGYSREEFLNLSIMDIRPEEDIPLIELFSKSEKAYSNIPPIWRHLKKNGELMYMNITSHVINFKGRRAALVHLNDVTEKVTAEGELLKTYKELSDYKFALDESSIVAITDQNGIITYVNDNFCNLSDYTREELLGNSHRLVNSGYHDPEFFKNMWETISNGKVWRGEIKNRKKDGSLYWVDATIVPFLDENAKPYQFMAVRFDISEKKKTEENILIKSRLLSAIAEVISILFKYDDWEWALDKSFGIVGEAVAVDRVYYFQNSFEPLTGEAFASQRLEWTKNTMTPQINNPDLQHIPFRSIAEFVAPLSKKQSFKAIVGQMEDNNTKKVLVAQDIKSIMALPIYIKDYFYGFVGFDDCSHEREWRDDEISFLQTLTSKLASAIEKREGLVALQEALEEKDTILESIGDAFYAVDKNWIVTYWNKKAEKILGTKREEIIGKNVWSIYADEKYSSFFANYTESMKENVVKHFEEFYPPLNVWLEISAYPSPSGLSIYFKDITERKMNEEKLKKINKELALSNSELEQFAFVASHDLQEPLRMITSFLSQLEKKYDHLLDDKGKKYIHFATDGAKRMRNIILDLLEFSRVGRTEEDKERVDLNDLLEEVVGLNRKIIQEKKAQITWDMELPKLYTFKSPLRLLFQNLINNALKYQLEGAVPTLTIKYEETKAGLQFVVADNGIGIESAYYDKIFTIFQRLHGKEEYSGTGVGLAICKKIVENFDGRIWVQSQPGKGSKFYFTLPANLKA